MINTIFYFPLAKLTYSDYATAVQNGEISGRTIVLDKASGKIFNQGKEYGYSKLEIDESVDRKIDDVKNDMDDVVDELNNTLDELNDHIDEVNDSLDNVINDLDDSIQDKVEDMISDSEWMQQNWPQGVTQYDSGWNENVKAYLLTVGLWDYGDDGSIVTKWSQLRQSVNSVSSEVNQVTRQGGRLDTLQSAINQEITDRGAAITQLSNTYTNTDAQTKKVLEWMYSGLKSSASANKSFNELYSAANSGDTTAIAGLRTDITNQLGNYVASTDLSSRVEGVIKNGTGVTSLANLAQKSDITSATTTLVNTYQLAGLQTSLSGLLSKANANEARLDIVTSLGENNTYTYNKSTLDSAVAGLMAESNSATNLYLAGLQVSSGNGQASTELASAINNNKNDIARLATKITGNSSDATVEAKLNGMSASLVTTSTLDTALVNVLATNNSGSAASIKTLAGNSSAVTSLGSRVDGVEATIDAVVDGSGSSVMIKADKIQLDGNTVANSISANNMTLTGHVQANDFQAGASNSLNIKTTGSKISFCDGSTEKAYFILEGSGLQLYIMDENGKWRKIDWSNWTDTSATSYTVLNLYQHTGGDDAANAFTLKNVYVANGNVYNDPDTTSGTPSGTFYVKTTPWEFISLTSSLYKLSSSVLYMWAMVIRNTNSDYVDPENAYAPVFSGYIDTYVEVLITNGQLVYDRNSNKYNIARQYPSDGVIYIDSLGHSTNSSRMNYSSTPIFINVDNDLLDDDYHYMYMNNVFYYKIERNPSDYITGTCVKKVDTFNDARTTSVFSFTEFNQ